MACAPKQLDAVWTTRAYVGLGDVLRISRHEYGKVRAVYGDDSVRQETSGGGAGVWPLEIIGKKCPECAGKLTGELRVLPCTCVYHRGCVSAARAYGVCNACRKSVKQWQFA